MGQGRDALPFLRSHFFCRTSSSRVLCVPTLEHRVCWLLRDQATRQLLAFPADLSLSCSPALVNLFILVFKSTEKLIPLPDTQQLAPALKQIPQAPIQNWLDWSAPGWFIGEGRPSSCYHLYLRMLQSPLYTSSLINAADWQPWHAVFLSWHGLGIPLWKFPCHSHSVFSWKKYVLLPGLMWEFEKCS